ncbi:Fis family transcriptional regulator [Desulfotomaculum nigrificans CO-1-SRB]|uniref:Fis family transcriptional regulator n=1 Tax=Desulfotomaculum nigrificans (strain DSM 14880 / VKM B-2319 / CO-1-SRB) TaxID=868595 RepID=F6B7R4_DESCC|nr:hypothetical protein [Desulfotomaculum nigrificans]AEF93436.1 Fis family transcriptional regulator [Desulfotomaculum nigrificans CO-1-SRB]
MKNIVKKFFLLIGTTVIIASLVTGCGSTNSQSNISSDQKQEQKTIDTSSTQSDQKQNAGDTGSNQSGQDQNQKTGNINKPSGPPKGGPDRDPTQDTAFLQDAASVLGITVDQLKSELQSGKKLDQIVTEKGMTMEQFHQKMPKPQQPPVKDNAVAKKGATAGNTTAN